ncbi:MAG TPA: CAAX prenyl protease-related protein [Verrucomicrobiae bacterium]|nr:CAAX prenyl protease-related protein [Verrucomicrobiae bacterium]
MADTLKFKPWLPYVVPMGLYMAFLLVEPYADLLWMYPVKTLAVAAALIYFWREYEELRSPMVGAGNVVRGQETGAQQEGRTDRASQKRGYSGTSWLLAVLVGLVAIVIWIGIDPYYPKFGTATVFDPTAIQSVAQRNTFFAFRVFGAVIVVPVMEELFWRAFLIRWLVNEDFKSVAIGTFSWMSFAVTVALFGAEHHQWLAGLICGAMYNWLYYKRKDVFACVVAHAVSNAALAAWVLSRGDWKFW